MHADHDIERGLQLWRVWVLHKALCFLLGLGLLLGMSAVLLRLWFIGIPLAVGSMVLYDLLVKLLMRRA